MRYRYLLVSATAFALALARSPEAKSQERIAFGRGGTSTTVSGSIKGDGSKLYIFNAKAGQTLTIDFRPSTSTLYYNVTKAGQAEALRLGSSTTVNPWTTTLPFDGEYVIDVYFTRSEVRRDSAATYTLKMTVVGQAKDDDDAELVQAGPQLPHRSAARIARRSWAKHHCSTAS